MSELIEMESSPQAGPRTPVRSRTLRFMLLAAGSVLVAVGTIGIFLPLLPTTIFYLLGAACFGRSSPAAYRWLTTNRFFGARFRAYREKRGATVGSKVTSIAMLWIGLGITLMLIGWTGWIAIALLAVGVAVSVHVLSLRTIRGNGESQGTRP
ncbi:MAG TPA: YbaN family protein [Dehalococcoidia bacterium]|nr:YbaN family protein [Dehalococcoidia bacterium]